jgi:hypothetical protein
LTYGLNVAVAVVAAVVLVVLVNVLIDWQVRRVPGAVKPWLRYDLTATRAYTLAPQTQRLLSDLDGDWRAVAVLRVDDKNGQDVADLLDEYARYSANLEVQRIDPDREPERLEAVYEEVEARFAEETAPLREAVARGVEALNQLAEDFAAMQVTFGELALSEDSANDSLKDSLRVLSNQLGELAQRYGQGATALREQMQQPFAPLGEARAALVNDLRRVESDVLRPFTQQFERQGRDRSASLKVRDTLLRMGGELQAIRQRIRQTVETLSEPDEAAAYDRLRSSLGGGDAVMLLGPESERVVAVQEMFISGGGGETAERQFLGEDRLTGALLTMRIEQPPRVVFVHDRPGSVLQARGGLSHVAARLTTAEFEVAEWAIGGGGGERDGATAAAAPPPVPDQGQAAVWVVPALDLQRTTQADRELVADRLRKRLAAGDGVMLCFDYDPEAPFRPSHPLIELSRAWGLSPQMHQLILRETLGADGRTRGDAGWRVQGQAEASPLSGALAGRTVQFAAVCPIEMVPRPATTTLPLIELDRDRAWLGDGLSTLEAIHGARYDPERAVESPVIAAAAYREAEAGQSSPVDPGRLVVVTERHWLTDAQAGRWLGNSEFFVNATYWLAGLDEAIAATPRTQDLRRIDAMSEGRALVYRLVLLVWMPVLALGVGLGVWWWRRRG